MDNIAQVLVIFAGVLGIVGGAAFIYAYYLVSLNRAQLEALRGDRDDLIKRVELLENDREILKQAADKKDTLIAEATAKITVLEGIVTHDASIQELIKTVNTHDRHVETRYDEYMKIISQVLQAVEVVLENQDRYLANGPSRS